MTNKKEDLTKNYDFVLSNTLDTIKNTTIKESSIHGFGLFATKKILKGTILQIFDGQIISNNDYKQLINNIANKIPELENYFFMECNKLDRETYLVRPFRTKYSYINHSFQCNVIIKKFPLRLIAKEDIDVNEELTIDYTLEELLEEEKEREFLKKS